MVKLYFIPHTHWDREWYLTFGEYRSYLLRTIDKVIEALDSGDAEFFLLDGQSSIILDYLSIRPEKRGKVVELVSRGKLAVGPWFTQPDEFLVSGESIVRNLLYGLKLCKELGGCFLFGYLPDIFGHTPQLPQILNGFGIDTLIFSRGYDASLGCDFIWRSPDGSEVFAHFLPDGYCHAAMLGYGRELGDLTLSSGPYGVLFPYFSMYEFGYSVDVDEALNRVKRIIERYKKCGVAQSILVFNGCDHLPLQHRLGEIIGALKEHYDVTQGGLEEFFGELKKKRKELKVYIGELRSTKFRPILTEVLSTRVYLKQMNFKAEKLLTAYLEPINLIVEQIGLGTYNRNLIDELWRLLLYNHAHDSICGTSIDEVHTENEARFNHVVRVANSEVIQYLEKIAKNITGSEPKIVVFNPNPWPSTSPVEVIIPSRGPRAMRVKTDTGEKSTLLTLETFELSGRKFEKCLFIAPSLKGVGYKAFWLEEWESDGESEKWVEGTSVRSEKYTYIIHTERGGVVEVVDNEKGESIGIFNILVDDGDVGDEYNYEPPRDNRVYSSEDYEVEDGETIYTEDIATTRLKLKMPIPKNSDKLRGRNRDLVEHEIEIEYRFYRKIPRIDVKISLENLAEDHRMRALQRINSDSKKIRSELHFIEWDREIPEREPVRLEDQIEVEPRVHPFHDYLYLKDERRVLGIATRGLYEYSAIKKQGVVELYITLFRSIGYLSRGDLDSRIGHAGPPIKTPEAQCKRRLEFEYSIIIGNDPWEVIKLAKEYTQPPFAVFSEDGKGDLGREYWYLGLNGSYFQLNALKKNGGGDLAVLRVTNLLDRENELELNWTGRIKETTLSENKVIGEQYGNKILLKPNKIHTFLLLQE